ncbi:uncharacterized protein CC84DRAFT_1166584 [Paraphaeosphaeria sporulosa]|uniref:Uncharacterized protein n=1 Tax=Paraphaeosphaeria sporulosa TaxID=1460663 RepID=A0A177C7M9_9PLEO|nr:uncharacterized protein CC84DRAFT_1166584 [Paraphaeosphaeria sporulosa]OAG02778.1 hypothetical protein CC84DRAFT_1166584 [Paraphaeosphaeria sporulosa]
MCIHEHHVKADAATLVAALDNFTAAVQLMKHLEGLTFAYDFQDSITSYGTASHQKLRKTSAKDDAEGSFQKGVPGGF